MQLKNFTAYLCLDSIVVRVVNGFHEKWESINKPEMCRKERLLTTYTFLTYTFFKIVSVK